MAAIQDAVPTDQPPPLTPAAHNLTNPDLPGGACAEPAAICLVSKRRRNVAGNGDRFHADAP